MAQLFDQLRDFLSEVENEKRASVRKRAEANTETTAQGGPTSHPSKNEDDGTTPATDGARSKENTGDVKKMIPAGGVDSASDDAASQEDQQYDVGIGSTSTGEDPSNEDNYKSEKEDPGTTHPATTDGEKYSSLHFGQLRKLAAYKANDILSDIVKRAEEECEEDEDEEESKKKDDDNEDSESDQEEVEEMAKEEAKEAGYIDSRGRLTSMGKVAAAAGEAAATLTNDQNHELVKQAQASVAGSIEHTIADGLEKAAMVGAYLQSFYKAAAEGEAAGGEGDAQPQGEAPEDGSGMEMDPSMLSQMAGEESAPQGAPPEGDAIQELLMALQEQGIEPEQLLQMIQSGALGGAGGEGGAPPMDPSMMGGAPMDPSMMGGAPMDPSMMGGAPPKMASYRRNQETVELVKLVKRASAVKNAQIRSGRFRVTGAKTAQQRVLRDQIKACVRDIIG